MIYSCPHEGQRGWINYRWAGTPLQNARRHNVLKCRVCGETQVTLADADWDGTRRREQTKNCENAVKTEAENG